MKVIGLKVLYFDEICESDQFLERRSYFSAIECCVQTPVEIFRTLSESRLHVLKISVLNVS